MRSNRSVVELPLHLCGWYGSSLGAEPEGFLLSPVVVSSSSLISLACRNRGTVFVFCYRLSSSLSIFMNPSNEGCTLSHQPIGCNFKDQPSHVDDLGLLLNYWVYVFLFAISRYLVRPSRVRIYYPSQPARSPCLLCILSHPCCTQQFSASQMLHCVT